MGILENLKSLGNHQGTTYSGLRADEYKMCLEEIREIASSDEAIAAQILLKPVNEYLDYLNWERRTRPSTGY